MILWLGLLLVCLGLTENTHLYAPLEQGSFAGLVVGIFLLLWSMRKTPSPSVGALSILVFAPVPLLLTHTGEVWPAFIISIAAALALVPFLREKASGLFSGAILAAGTTLILIATSRLYAAFSPHAKDLSFVSRPVAGFLRFLGHDATSTDGAVFVRTFSEQISHVISIDHLLPLPLVLMVLGGAFLIGVKRRSKQLSRFGMICALFVPIRYLLLLLAMLELEERSLFWNEGWSIASLVPLPILFSLFLRSRENPARTGDPIADAPIAGAPNSDAPRPEASVSESPSTDAVERKPKPGGSRLGHPALQFALLTGAAIFGVLWLHWPDAGKTKNGRILIDEAHSNWEWTTEPMDTLWYGKRSTYNFYSLAKFLNYYYDVEPSHAPLTPDLLEQYDILILKTPTVPFTDEEIDEIERFVENGGGLWLVGDHTNVFGTSTRLNPIASRFGLEFVHDVTYDLRHGGLNLYRPPTLEHPVVRHVQDFLFATSCSLRTSLDAQPVQIGTNLLTLPLDYAEHGFFPKTGRQSWESRFGSFVQTAATRKGLGRVVAFSDSTCFSNFFVHVPGKPELAIGTMEWLNRQNRSTQLRPLAGVTALVFSALSLFLLMRIRTPQKWSTDVLPLGLAGLLFGVGIGSVGVSTWSRLGYPWPEPRRPLPEILFEGERSRFFLPEKQLVAGSELEHFLTFYVWSQRLGLVPRVERSFQKTFENPETPVVLIRPQESFSSSDIAHVRSYLEQGGQILVLDDPLIGESKSNDLLAPFGIEFVLGEDPPEPTPKTLVDVSGEAVLDVPMVHHGIRGAKPLLTTDDEAKTVVVARKAVGRGGLLVCSLAYLFSAKHMGYTGNWPDTDQAQRYELEYWMLRGLDSGDFSKPLDMVRKPPEYRQQSHLYLARTIPSAPGF